jgi:hypothetical protein
VIFTRLDRISSLTLLLAVSASLLRSIGAFSTNVARFAAASTSQSLATIRAVTPQMARLATRVALATEGLERLRTVKLEVTCCEEISMLAEERVQD